MSERSDRSTLRTSRAQPEHTVHFSWKDAEPPDALFPKWWRESWRQEGWQLRLWTDSDILDFFSMQSPEVRKLINSYPKNIMRCDAFRYFLLREHGGLYVDLDFVCLSSLDWLGEIDLFACGAQGEGCLCNALMWAPYPQDPFLEGIEETLFHYSVEPHPVPATGPRLLTHHAARGQAFFEIPSNWIYPLNWDVSEQVSEAKSLALPGLMDRFPHAKAVHMWSGSWA